MDIKYCEHCSDFTTYVIRRELFTEEFNGISINYEGDRAYCSVCNYPVLIEDIETANDRIFNKLYREAVGIVNINEIKELLFKYRIGATVLCKLLKWGDVTITRYIGGQLPSAEYSSSLRKLKDSPIEMLNLLENNKDKILELSYKKSKEAVLKILNETAITETKDDSVIDTVIEYILFKIEVTPKALQKILYFVQGFSSAFNENVIFVDIPQAWEHGPVYNLIYKRYKHHGYEPIDRIENKVFNLSEVDKELIDNVIRYFGCYNANILEKITHKEMPWLKARKGLCDKDSSCNPIRLEDIKNYFTLIKDKYKIINFIDINEYANSMFRQVQ